MRRGLALTLLAGLLTGGAYGSAAGATLARVSVDEMLAGAELVFEGRVVGVRTKRHDSGRLESCVRFVVLDVLKGAVARPQIELCFAGGKARGVRMEVPGLIHPRRGERGIYFVASRTRGYWNPLYGWDQGHFVVEPAEPGGASVVKTARRRSVVDVAAGGPSSAGELSRGIARGVRVAEGRPGARRRPRALSPGEFKARLRALLEGRSP